MIWILLGIIAVVEIWYWGYYFPKCWKNEGLNREVDDLRYFVEKGLG